MLYLFFLLSKLLASIHLSYLLLSMCLSAFGMGRYSFLAWLGWDSLIWTWLIQADVHHKQDAKTDKRRIATHGQENWAHEWNFGCYGHRQVSHKLNDVSDYIYIMDLFTDIFNSKMDSDVTHGRIVFRERFKVSEMRSCLGTGKHSC